MIYRKEDYIAVNNINQKGQVSYYPQFFTSWLVTPLKRIWICKLFFFLQTVDKENFFLLVLSVFFFNFGFLYPKT